LATRTSGAVGLVISLDLSLLGVERKESEKRERTSL
jgi:hypothetical protein